MFCKECGKEISDKAVICPKCGTSTGGSSGLPTTDKSKTAALLLCLFLGGIGAHIFYLGRPGSAIGMIVCLIFVVVTPIWALVDLIRICTGSLKPVNGDYKRD